MAKVPQHQFSCECVDVRSAPVARPCPGGALPGGSSCRNILGSYQNLQSPPRSSQSPFVLQQTHLQVSKTPSGSLCVLSNAERQKPTAWRGDEQGGGEKEGPGRKMLLVTRSLLCPPHPRSDINERSCLAGGSARDLQLFSLQRSAAQLFPRHYKNYSALRLTRQSSLFSAAGLKYLLS